MIVAARLQHLTEVEPAIWRELAAATIDSDHGWHVATLATWDGCRVDARSVVLREFDDVTRTLLIYTDARSAKARQLEHHPHGTLVGWSAALGWQLRMQVRLSLQTVGLAVSSRWARLKMTPAARDYLSPLPPGAPLAPACAQPQRSTRDHFAVIEAHIEAFDWLELGAREHRRACIDGDGARWITP